MLKSLKFYRSAPGWMNERWIHPTLKWFPTSISFCSFLFVSGLVFVSRWTVAKLIFTIWRFRNYPKYSWENFHSYRNHSTQFQCKPVNISMSDQSECGWCIWYFCQIEQIVWKVLNTEFDFNWFYYYQPHYPFIFWTILHFIDKK